MYQFTKQLISALPQWMRSSLLPLLLTVRVGGLILAAGAILGFFVIAEEVLEKESQSFDTAILLALWHLHNQLLDRIMVVITFLGEPEVLLTVCIGVGVWLMILGRRSQASTLAIAGVGAMGLNYWLKVLFSRERPALWERVVDVSQSSFPSGHAMISMVVYGTIGYLLAANFPKWRRWILIFSLLLIGAIGLSRLYLGVHWPTDVAAGFAAGVVWLVACILSLEIWQQLRSLRSGEPQMPQEE